MVEASRLPDLPLAFQQYVERYFAPTEIFGTLVLYAFQALHLKELDRRPARGVAPSHSVDISQYRDGLNGQSLAEWISGAVTQGLILRLGAGWDDGTLSFAD